MTDVERSTWCKFIQLLVFPWLQFSELVTDNWFSYNLFLNFRTPRSVSSTALGIQLPMVVKGCASSIADTQSHCTAMTEGLAISNITLNSCKSYNKRGLFGCLITNCSLYVFMSCFILFPTPCNNRFSAKPFSTGNAYVCEGDLCNSASTLSFTVITAMSLMAVFFL